MASENQDGNIIQMKKKRGFRFNIGFVIFLIIFIYTMYFIIRYITIDHTSVYMVETGSLVQDDTFTGICIRDETVYYADDSGVIIYYASESDRVGAHTLVYSLDSSGVITQMIDSAENASDYLTDENYEDLQQTLKNFTFAYSDMNFYTIYDLANTTNSTLRDDMNANALSKLTASASESSDALGLNYAETEGIVEYYTDGYETLLTEAVTSDMLDPTSYTPIQLENNVEISSGDAVYKLINDENWDVVIEVSDEMAALLTEMGTVEVTFLKDYYSAYATVEIIKNDEATLAVLHFTNSMVRYADSRYVELKLTLDQASGLKIPLSSVTSKEFDLVPISYATTGGDSDSTGFMVQTTDEDGNDTVTFVSPTLYYATDEYYYISDDEIGSGSVIVMPDSSETYTISETDSLKGVYNINKGYAVFKQINILYSNSDYAIIEEGTNYGLSQYDYIVLDADTIKEGELAN